MWRRPSTGTSEAVVQQRLDLSPPVPGLDSSRLRSGRWRLGSSASAVTAVAAVVYLRRQHVINVFSWPRTQATTGALSVATSQGYHLVSWRSNGVAFWVVSDLNPAELSQFVALFQLGGGADVNDMERRRAGR